MERFFGIVLTMLAALMVLGFVLGHVGTVAVLFVAAALVGRHLRQHGA
jgi:hypothetical protein